MNNLGQTMKIKENLLPLILICNFVWFGGCFKDSTKSFVCFQKHCFEVEIATNDLERAQGLQNRQKLDEDKGMLFIFSYQDVYPFWMKSTLIPLDIIWLDYNKRIVHIKHNAPPCQTPLCPTYTPSEDAIYVVELNGGVAEKINLKIGDVGSFKLSSE